MMSVDMFLYLVQRFRPVGMLRFSDQEGTPTICQQLHEHASVLDDYCRLSQRHVVSVTWTDESGRAEPLYYFGGEDGAYTIEGVRASVRELSDRCGSG